MHEAYFYDLRFGNTVVTFDGSVIDIFYDGYHARHHRYLVAISPLTGPDRKGAYQATLAHRSDGREVFMFSADESNLPRLAPLVAAVQAAG